MSVPVGRLSEPRAPVDIRVEIDRRIRGLRSAIRDVEGMADRSAWERRAVLSRASRDLEFAVREFGRLLT